MPLALRLYLPEVWTEIPPAWPRQVCLSRRSGTGPSPRLLSPSSIVLGAEVRFGVVLADAAYGSRSGFRHALSQRGLTWAVGSLALRRSTRSRSGSPGPWRRADVRARGPSQTSGLLRRRGRHDRDPGDDELLFREPGAQLSDCCRKLKRRRPRAARRRKAARGARPEAVPICSARVDANYVCVNQDGTKVRDTIELETSDEAKKRHS